MKLCDNLAPPALRPSELAAEIGVLPVEAKQILDQALRGKHHFRMITFEAVYINYA